MATDSKMQSNRRLNAAATAIVAVVALAGVLPFVWNERPPHHHDFDQFYMGGLVARSGQWANLYPVPVAGSPDNPGWPRGSTMKPGYAALAGAAGVGNEFRFIQLPPNALLYLPLSWLSVQNAYRAWHVVMAGFVVMTARMSGRIYDRVAGHPAASAGAAGVTLLVGCAPLMHYAQQVGNTGPLLAACVAAAVLGMMSPERRLGSAHVAGGVVVGGFTKYAPGVLLPIAVAQRRWRTVLHTLLLAAAVTAITLAVTGTGVWVEYWKVLWPPLQNSSNTEPNQGLPGFVSRVTGVFPLHAGAARAIRSAQLVTLLAVLAPLVVRRKSTWDSPANIAAAAAALLAWLLIFAPVSWQFYHCMLMPLWGWLICEAARGGWRMRSAVTAALLLTIFPTPGKYWGRLPEPLATRQLFSAFAVLGLALWRMTRHNATQ